MFCPKCGELLEEIGGWMTCRKGNMGLSINMANGLRECFIAKTRNPSDKPFTFRVGGRWFCPGCGVRMAKRSGLIRCPKCSRSLNEFIYPLVEVHPHNYPWAPLNLKDVVKSLLRRLAKCFDKTDS